MRKMSIGFLMLLLTIMAGARARAQEAPSADAAAKANAAYTAKNWAEAVRLYEQLAIAEPGNARYWYRLGVAAQSGGRLEKALDAYEKALATKQAPPVVEYNLACVHAAMKHTEKAFDHLAEAVKQGFSQPEKMTADAELAALRSDERFPKLVEQARRNLAPCDYTAENRQFDFWVGEWDVESTHGGIPAGTSRIERILGDCVILENWSSAGSSYGGKSYNIYNPNLKRWEQFWVDNVGGMIQFYGGLKDGVMDYTTDEIPQPDGTKLKRHLQFFNLAADKVRQFSQGSTDGGKTWTVEYDFTYNRKK